MPKWERVQNEIYLMDMKEVDTFMAYINVRRRDIATLSEDVRQELLSTFLEEYRAKKACELSRTEEDLVHINQELKVLGPASQHNSSEGTAEELAGFEDDLVRAATNGDTDSVESNMLPMVADICAFKGMQISQTLEFYNVAHASNIHAMAFDASKEYIAFGGTMGVHVCVYDTMKQRHSLHGTTSSHIKPDDLVGRPPQPERYNASTALAWSHINSFHMAVGTASKSGIPLDTQYVTSVVDIAQQTAIRYGQFTCTDLFVTYGIAYALL